MCSRVLSTAKVINAALRRVSRDTTGLNAATNQHLRNRAPYALQLRACSQSLVKQDAAQVKTGQTMEEEEELDKLYKYVEVEVRGHDPAVLRSYKWYATEAAKMLNITVSNTWEPKKVHHRLTLLKAPFGKKKHMVQYEARTYFQVIQLKHLTGSTADTYLEYVQRNLPEGVAMKVTKTSLERLPDYIKPPTQAESSERTSTEAS
ncbi:28S ribosomal protein S10, mitochondrial [Ixodes scapularis]